MEKKFDLEAAQKFAEKIARAAGEVALAKFGKSKIAVEKVGADFATDADLASEKLIVDAIKKEFPEHAIIAEESGAACGNEFCWVIDPLDGTKNFHAGVPMWCVSIALQKKGETVVGVVFAPVVDQLFSARKDGGAKLNGEQISVSAIDKIEASTVVVEIPRRAANGENFVRDFAGFRKACEKVVRMRAYAAAAYDLCLVASGHADAYLDFSGTTKIWDVAAGALLVREAGGQTSDLTPADAKFPTASVLATNGKLHAEFAGILES